VVTAAASFVDLQIAFVFGLVLFVATIAFGVVGLGLASTTTMLTLLNRTALGVYVVKLPIRMRATANTMAFNARGTGKLLSIDKRHAWKITAESGRGRLDAIGRMICR